MKREFLQLAHTYDPNKHGIGGWYVSEKLDGMRAYWDGGWTRGLLTSQVPFANTAKDYRRLSPPYSTGLWTRYAKPIAAPSWWLDDLPDFPLDGELYSGPGQFQQTISWVKKFVPIDEEWEQVEYRIFDLPSDYFFLASGKINNPQWTLDLPDVRDQGPDRRYGPMNFHKINRMIELGKISLGKLAEWETQIRLSMQTYKAVEELEALVTEFIGNGGEGAVLRKPSSVWQPTRSHDLLKVKPWADSEALVTGYTWGKGKLEGLMGAMIVEWQGKTFELSGFTDAERELIDPRGPGVVFGRPGSTVDTEICVSRHFPVGCAVTFRYRELTDDGIPKEARYWRKA